MALVMALDIAGCAGAGVSWPELLCDGLSDEGVLGWVHNCVVGLIEGTGKQHAVTESLSLVLDLNCSRDRAHHGEANELLHDLDVERLSGFMFCERNRLILLRFVALLS